METGQRPKPSPMPVAGLEKTGYQNRQGQVHWSASQ